MANGIFSALMPGGGTQKRATPQGLLNIDPMTWFQLSGALAQGAEQNSFGTALGGVGGVLQNRALLQQDQRDRAQESAYRKWQMGQAEQAAEFDRRQADIMNRYRQAGLDLNEREFEWRRGNPAAGKDQFRPITPEERTAFGIETDTPYAMNVTTNRPVAIGGTRTQEWTQGQRTNASYVANMADAYNRMTRIVASGFDPRGVVAGRPRWTMSETGRDFYRAMRDYAEAELRSETGAAATQDEIDRKLEQLMAGVNESEQNVETIFNRMRTRIGSMAQAQGGAYEALYPDARLAESPTFESDGAAEGRGRARQRDTRPIVIQSEAEAEGLPRGTRVLLNGELYEVE